METIYIEPNSHDSVFYLRYENEDRPFGYVARCGDRWWAAIPGGGVCGYFATRSEAIAAII